MGCLFVFFFLFHGCSQGEKQYAACAEQKYRPPVMEPIYDVEVLVPSDYMGDVMSDLQGRRGMIMGMESEGNYQVLKAKVPLKEMSTYSTSLSSITGGSGSFVMSFANYELVPTDVQNELIKEFEAKQKEEE